ncbi:MAG: hypothetical protein DMG57_10635 [Acidobacteria bacterium]|nr:MAG: hypothetical protein DMG57_10635 [Acidobacteriota bacterium]
MKSENGDTLRKLRHELRTPLNHILGYAEMLMEDAGLQRNEKFLARLSEIRAAATELVAVIGGDVSDRESLRERVAGPVSKILEQSAALLGQAPGESVSDLERIRAAAGRLLALAGEAGASSSEEETAAEDRSAAVVEGLETAAVAGMGRLLVVDDNEDNREVLRRHLQRQGYHIAVAENGLRALETVRQGGFDLVLLDIVMPALDGFEVLKRMKAEPALRDIPVIMISALDEIQSVVRCIEMGAEDYLGKPFDPVLLRARIGASVEKKRLRDQLVVQEKLASLGTLTAGIAHEIRNPLNFVTNFAELSVELVRELRQSLDPAAAGGVEDILADLEQNAAKIRDHGKRADSIVHSMLLHSRSQPGEREMTDFNALVADNINLAYHGLRAQDASFSATIESEYDPSVGLVSVVPQDINRVFLNIANNAFYAVHQKGKTAGEGFKPTVRVCTRNAGARVEVSIRDNGNGVAKATRKKIFTPFFTTKPAGAGTGLGLSISYDVVVREHHGEILVESEEGSFAEFRVILPRGEEQGAAT